MTGDLPLKVFEGGRISADGGRKCHAGIVFPEVPRKIVCDLDTDRLLGSGMMFLDTAKKEEKYKSLIAIRHFSDLFHTMFSRKKVFLPLARMYSNVFSGHFQVVFKNNKSRN